MDEQILTFATETDWASWLMQHGTGNNGIWLRLAKQGAPHATLSYAQALEVALCHGWIDGQKRADDAHHWLQRFTPRRARSVWSQINRDKAQALIDSGRMQPAGLQQVHAAQQDGRWDAAYAPASKATVPDDLQAALDATPQAAAFFATLSSANRYAILYRLQQCKTPQKRAEKLALMLGMLLRGETFH
ncbi:Uncharacterized conserved protein YdeI, YjbR/CyaY-like superfamily, DUF1801 family [Andreprevotia lacus DSM 23236]|jgi:uncharacterized protein YdeI (YjbR/CyaY-like superfamily)|uniref:Uncharacterized conserved protein YdeI, YjbR/CyaY-like superfamily, DUF1801 family n=1 Tax=Andreprevotia lacus DSM 23236 TaxID=1121001 RepID=A0A1W1XYZ3_9NEIS|nr:YdeI/OmpD-associated family protein [Andreprevotia lacus]SMC29095.1 Uncharacterized conserved protein YdeI, YjbR/CyaY-like superfamily, DUF1801 family [Andreprevotia lacus DSM 23236]